MASVLRVSYMLPFSCIDRATVKTRRNLRGFCFREKSAVKPLSLMDSSYVSKKFRFSSFLSSAASGEVSKVEDLEEVQLQEDSEKEEPTIDDGLVYDSSSDETIPFTSDKLPSAIITSLELYKEALGNNDQSKIDEIESFFQSIEDERNSLENKVTSLSEELAIEKDRILRITADFENFRKRTERERLSLMENVQGEVLERLLPVLDNFERAKAQIKLETEGEEKINSSYQSIYKQFMDLLTSLGVLSVETVGTAFDPMLHEAIMREDSEEFEEGRIVQEFRKGFKLGERLLRPSMVKVSAGPGPEKPKEDEAIKSDESSDELDQESTKQSE